MLRTPVKNRVYFGIHVEGKKPKRRFWRNLVFDDDVFAQFYLDQECFALPEASLPQKFRVDYVEEWEITGRNATQENLQEFYMDEIVTVMFMDANEFEAMGLKMHLQKENPPHFFYTSRFILTGNPNKEDIDLKKSDDIQMFGLRLRPSCFAPNRRTHISLRDGGLPGLWYFTIGYRQEMETLPVFLDDLDPCLVCPANKS